MKIENNMEIVRDQNEDPIFIIFGSGDSRDIDLLIAVTRLPERPDQCHGLGHQMERELKERYFAEDDRKLNANLGVIDLERGFLKAVWKGDADECNNSILNTWRLHQQFGMAAGGKNGGLIRTRMKRVVGSKAARAVRVISSCFTRLECRAEAKRALRGNFREKIQWLKEVSFQDYPGRIDPKRVGDVGENLKKAAFQMAQCGALIEGVEIYSKAEAIALFPDLADFIYLREGNVSVEGLKLLDRYLNEFLERLESLDLPDDQTELPWNKVCDI